MAGRAKQADKTKAGSGKAVLTGTKAPERELFHGAAPFPDPILEIDSQGSVTYLNPAAAELFPDVHTRGGEHPILEGLAEVRVKLKDHNQKSVIREVTVGHDVYEQHFYYIPDTKRVRIYGRNITGRKKLARELESHYRELQTLHDISQIILNSPDLRTIMPEVLNKALQIGPFDIGVIRLLEPGGKILKPVAMWGYRDLQNLKDKGTEPGDPTSGTNVMRAMTDKGAQVVENVPESQGLRGYKKEGVQSAVVVPVRAGEEVLGIFQLGSRTPRKFRPQQISLLEAIGSQVGIAAQKARLFEEVKKNAFELEEANREIKKSNLQLTRLLEEQHALREILTQINLVDMDELLKKIAEHSLNLLKVDHVQIRLLDKSGLLRRVAIAGKGAERLQGGAKLGSGRSTWVMENCKTLAIKDISQDKVFGPGHFLQELGVKGYLLIPMISRGQKPIGVIGLSTLTEREFTPEEIALGEQLASGAAIAIENAKLYEESEKQQKIQKLLKELSQDVTFLDTEILFKRLTDRVREFFGVDVCDVRMIEDWRPVGVSGIEPERIRGSGTKQGRSRWILENRKPLAVADIVQEAGVPIASTTRRIGLRGYVAVPLFSGGGEVIGVMRALTYRPREFTQEEIDLLQQVANGAALCLENAKLFRETELRAKEQSVLNAIAVATSQSLDLKGLLQSALDKVLEVIGRERGYIRLKDSATGEVTLAAHRGISEKYIDVLMNRRTPGGKTDQVFESGEPLVVNDLEGTLLKEESRQEGSCAIVWIPLKARAKVVGVLNVQTSRPVPFIAREVELLQAIGNVIGVAVENARLFEETRRSLDRVRALREIDQAMSSTLDLQMVLELFLEKMAPLFPYSTVTTVRLLNKERWRLEPLARHGLSMRQRGEEQAVSPDTLAQHVFNNSVPLVINDLAQDPRAAEGGFCRRHGFASYLGVPLTAKGERLGVISLYTLQAHRFTDEEVDLLSTLAGQAALAIQNSQLYEQTRIQAVELKKTNKGLQRREEIQKLLKEVSQDITFLDFDSLLTKLTAKVREFFRIDISDVRVVEGGSWRQMGVSGIEPERLRGTGRPRPRANWVTENRKPLMIPDMTKATDLSAGETTRRLGIRGYLAVPLFSRSGEVIGMLRALSYQPREFTQEEMDLLQQLANGAALAVENVRLFGETRRTLERVRALREIDQAITSTLHLETVLNVLLEKIDLFHPRSAATIRLFNEESGLLEPVASRNLEEAEWKVGEWRGGRGLTNAVFETKSPIIVRDARTDPRVLDREFYRRHQLVSYLGVPLIAKDQVLGVLNFYTKREQEIGNQELDFLSTIAGQAAIAIHNSQLYERLKKQADELETANKVKDEFLSVMSHELRTPLNVVVGYTEMMRDQMLGEINQEQRRALGKVIRRSRELLDMIDSVLQATSIEAKTVKVESCEFSLAAFLGDLKSSYDVPLSGETAMVWDIPPDLPSVKSDAEKLKRILQSLIHNAIKFTPEGRITISARYLQNTNMVEFKVADTGIGIPQELQPFIFEIFRQGDSSETRAYGGVGLGLYIAKRLTEMMGGTIAVESSPGKGSSFTVAIPREGLRMAGSSVSRRERVH